MDAEKQTSPLDLNDLFSRFLKQLARLWPLILILGLLSGGVNVWRAHRSFVPSYESSALFSVNAGYSSDDIFASQSYYNNAAAEQLATAFPNLLNIDIMRELVLQQLGTTYLNGYTTASAAAETNMFTLTTRSPSPEDAYAILNAIIDCYPQVAVYMVDNPQVIILKDPTVPTEPWNSFSWKSAALKGGLVGVALAVALMLVLALLSHTVNSTDQLKEFLNLPILATLPHITRKKRRKQNDRFLNLHADQNWEESMRGLRVKVLKKLGEEPHKTLLLTSTLPGEGKSTISANLALTLAEHGSRVVLVDADLHKQSLADMLGCDPEHAGLLACLDDLSLPPEEQLQKVPSTSLMLLSGMGTQNRHYNFEAKRVRHVLRTLAAQYDYVVVDTPPCGIVSETGALVRHADAVFYVVKQ
ncbi:MAG: P-loop NTPase, partial [Clostridia bacterium]|nr:P-loop NTPase [Clostridia bacterium]